MKIRRLLEVDLARLTSLPINEQRERMQRLLKGGGRFSFGPTRDQFSDILNVQPPMFEAAGPLPMTDFEIIENKLRKACRYIEELIFNIQAARMLHSHFRGEEVISRHHSFGYLPIGLDRGMQFWTQSFYPREGLPVITYIDPRGAQGLTKRAREVVFSAMHASIRERHPDFQDAILEIIQLPYDKRYGVQKGQRALRVHTLVDEPTYTFTQLDKMFTATLRLWDTVAAEAQADKRKQSGTRGSLL